MYIAPYIICKEIALRRFTNLLLFTRSVHDHNAEMHAPTHTHTKIMHTYIYIYIYQIIQSQNVYN